MRLPLLINRIHARHYDNGFSLIEIMIVVAVVGLLMAIAIPNYFEARNDAYESTCISNQRTVYAAAVMYVLDEAGDLEAMEAGERLQALIDEEYIRNAKYYECPASGDDDNDDYTLTFEGGFVSDIECDEFPTDHLWPRAD